MGEKKELNAALNAELFGTPFKLQLQPWNQKKYVDPIKSPCSSDFLSRVKTLVGLVP